jgi:hypothetical protein
VASADFDEDGDVDGADFLTWQRGLGAGSTHAEGDADGDGGVDAGDLAAWRYQFGSIGAALPVSSPVPEPTGLAAIVTVAVIGRAGRRHRRGVC